MSHQKMIDDVEFNVAEMEKFSVVCFGFWNVNFDIHKRQKIKIMIGVGSHLKRF